MQSPANGQSQPKDAQLAVQVATQPQATEKQPTYAELQALVAKLQAERALKASVRIVLRDADTKYPQTVDGKETMVPGKGNIVAYGLGRFPISMYASQWERLLTPENVKLILQLCKDPKASRKE